MQTFYCSLLQCNKLFTYLVVALRDNCIILQMCSSRMTAASRYQNSTGKKETPLQTRAVNFGKENCRFLPAWKDKCHTEATSIFGRSLVCLKTKLVNIGDVPGVELSIFRSQCPECTNLLTTFQNYSCNSDCMSTDCICVQT